MANEVTNETEESTQENNSPVSEQANTNTSDAPAAEASAPVSNETADQADNSAATAQQPAGGTETANQPEEDFGKILEKFEQAQTVYNAGELVEGKVVGVSERGVLIDFGHKSEGIAPIEDFTSGEGETTVAKGDMVEVIIRTLPSGDAPPQLSRLDAVTRKSWDDIEKAFEAEQPVVARALEVTKGGLRVDINGVEAFMPGSQVDSRPMRNLNSYIGQDLEAKIIKFSRKRNNIVLSRKELTDAVVNKLKAETLSQIAEGYVIEGTVRSLTEYGAFLDIGGLDGLLHVTDMAWGRLMNPHELFRVNDTVQVKILKLDREKEKIALGYKQLIPDPWSTVIELYPVGSKIKGRVSSVAEYGAFIELEPGVEGLVHVSEMSWSKRSLSPKKMVHSGDEIEVQVLGVDTDDRRISLGMKQLQPNPWQTVHERYHVGQTIRGKVRNLTDFGAFVEMEDGIDGLVHVSDISHSKKIKHPKDVLKRDQEVEAVIRSIDVSNRRMSLSIKELTPSVWELFVATHKPGDTVRGKISRFTGFGVFVELGNELEGLCHISELSEERIERPEDIGEIGQEMDFKILRIERGEQKIGLSARAVGRADEPVIDTKNYSTEAKGGMASLGELMNLRRGGEDEPKAEQQPKMSKKERKAMQAQERAEQERLAAEKAAQAEAEPATATAEDTETESEPAAAEPQAETSEPATEETPAESTETPAETTEPAAEDAQAETEPAAEETQAEEAQAETAAPTAEETAAPETSADEAETTDAQAADTAIEPVAAEPENATEAQTETSETAEAAEPQTEATEPATASDDSKNDSEEDDLLELGDSTETPAAATETEPILETEPAANDQAQSDSTANQTDSEEEKTANGSN